MKCINCGAVLTDRTCRFCGTKYNGGTVEADFEEDQYTGTLKVDGKKYQVCISRMEDCIIFVNGGRTADGTFTGKFLKKKRKFTLIEM